MKCLSDNLLMLALALVLGISPLQTITASVSKCADMNSTNMNQGMHHQMKASDKATHHDMSQSDTQNNCCEQNACDMSHCAGTIAAVVSFDTQNDMTYIVSNVHLKPSISLIQFYPSSLYRPPRV